MRYAQYAATTAAGSTEAPRSAAAGCAETKAHTTTKTTVTEMSHAFVSHPLLFGTYHLYRNAKSVNAPANKAIVPNSKPRIHAVAVFWSPSFEASSEFRSHLAFHRNAKSSKMRLCAHRNNPLATRANQT